MKKNFKNGIWTGVLIGALFATGVMGLMGAIGISAMPLISTMVNHTNVDKKLSRIESLIDQYFLYDTDEEQMEEYIYKGLVAGLEDPYAAYYTAEEYRSVLRSTEGSYCGIGVTVSTNRDTNETTIQAVNENGPAAEAGLQVGDILKAVDGIALTEMDLTKMISDYILGEEGTYVELEVYRPSEDSTLRISVERRIIETETVVYKMMDNQIGYLKISAFDVITLTQFEEALNALQADGAKGLIIDLRNNTGGRLDIAVKMLADILPDGMLVYTEDKDGKGDRYISRDGQVFFESDYLRVSDLFPVEDKGELDLPLVVLINEKTASSSELFAQAIQDYDWGTILGTQSYGKGIVQTTYTLGDGSALKLTSARYLTKSGKSIHKLGVTPDVVVEAAFTADAGESSEADMEAAGGQNRTAAEDPQLSAAITLLTETEQNTAGSL